MCSLVVLSKLHVCGGNPCHYTKTRAGESRMNNVMQLSIMKSKLIVKLDFNRLSWIMYGFVDS